MAYTRGKKRIAIANVIIQERKGAIIVNRVSIQTIQPKALRVKIFESILPLGVDKFKDLKIRVRASWDGPTTQLYVARTAIAKGIAALDLQAMKYILSINIQISLYI